MSCFLCPYCYPTTELAYLTQLYPAAIPANGMVMVELRGVNLFQSNLMAVRVDGSSLVVSSHLFWESATVLRFLAPPHVSGSATIDFSYNQVSTEFSNSLFVEYLGLNCLLF